MSRPTPDSPDADEHVVSRLVFEAGDPTVEPRPEHVADLRALILSRLGPPRTAWPSRTRWLFVSGLAAACLVAALAWPRGDRMDRVSGHTRQPSHEPIAPRPRQDPASIATWANVRRGLNLSEMPDYSWPLQESSHLSRMASIPADLLD